MMEEQRPAIDDKVVYLARQFQNDWNSLLTDYPKYALDLSWPSVGTLDLILSPLRFAGEIFPEQRKLLLGASAYLAGMAYDCWTHFPESPKVWLTLTEVEEPEITLGICGGHFLEQDQIFSVNVTSALRRVLTAPENPLPFFEQSTRSLTYSHNIVSLFAVGLFSGLCPYGKGRFTKLRDETALPHLIVVNELLSRSAAEYYSKVFPGEALGASAALYRDRIVMPPPGHREKFPAIRSASALVEYMKTQEVPSEDMQRLALNLAHSPDEFSMITGFSVLAALSSPCPCAELQAVGESLSGYRPYLRPAVMAARKVLDLPYNWLADLRQGKKQEALELARYEEALGLLPLMRMPLERIQEPELESFVTMLAWSRPEEARSFLDTYSETTPLSMDLVFEALMLDLVLRDFDRAATDLSALEQVEIVDPLRRSRFFNLKGAYAEGINNADSARACYEEVLKSASAEQREFISAGNGLARCLLQIGNHEQALAVIESVLAKHPWSISSLICRVRALDALGRSEESAETLNSVLRLAPADRTAFQLLVSQLKRGLV